MRAIALPNGTASGFSTQPLAGTGTVTRGDVIRVTVATVAAVSGGGLSVVAGFTSTTARVRR